MSAEVIEAIGTYIIGPICAFGFLAWLVYIAGRDN